MFTSIGYARTLTGPQITKVPLVSVDRSMALEEFWGTWQQPQLSNLEIKINHFGTIKLVEKY